MDSKVTHIVRLDLDVNGIFSAMLALITTP